MSDLDDLMLDPIYDTLGVEASFFKGDATEPLATLLVIDKTRGVEVTGSKDISVQSVLPVAAVKSRDVIALGLTPADFIGATIELNGLVWKVQVPLSRPGIKGELAGQFYFHLRKARNG